MRCRVLKAGPRITLFCVKTGPICLIFLFLRISFTLQKEQDFFKYKSKNEKVVLKTGPILLRNMLGPVLKHNLGPILNI